VQKRRTRVRWAEVAVALLVLAAIVAAFVFLLRRPTRWTVAVPDAGARRDFNRFVQRLSGAFDLAGITFRPHCFVQR
jgi:hypothetical protein